LLARSAGLGGPGAAVGQRSSRVGSMAGANALLVLGPGGTVEKGTRVQALMMGQIIGE
jgi:gephyrin